MKVGLRSDGKYQLLDQRAAGGVYFEGPLPFSIKNEVAANFQLVDTYLRRRLLAQLPLYTSAALGR